MRAESALPQHDALAPRARGSHRLGVQTVVAHEPLCRSVIRETDRAVRTRRDVAAVGTLNERRIPAPVEQENALLALRQAVGQRVLELLADHEAQPVRRVARAQSGRDARRVSFPAIDDVDLGQPRLAHALGQRQQRVLPARRIDPALETRRRASEHDDRALVSRSHDRDLSRVIARRLTLLVARLVLLVHDDRAEVLERREDRRARANGDPLATLLEREPFVIPLAVAQRAVQHRDLVAEHGAKAIDRLRRERDLRHEDDRRLSLLEHDAPQQLDVDERFSAAGHAVEQEHVARAAGRERRDGASLRSDG